MWETIFKDDSGDDFERRLEGVVGGLLKDASEKMIGRRRSELTGRRTE